MHLKSERPVAFLSTIAGWILLIGGLFDLVTISPMAGLTFVRIPVSLLLIIASSSLGLLSVLCILFDSRLRCLRDSLSQPGTWLVLLELMCYGFLSGLGLFAHIQFATLGSFWTNQTEIDRFVLRLLPAYLLFAAGATLWLAVCFCRIGTDAQSLLRRIVRVFRWSLLLLIPLSPLSCWISEQIVFMQIVVIYGLVLGGLLCLVFELRPAGLSRTVDSCGFSEPHSPSSSSC